MSRAIDRLPSPAEKRRMKVIVASCSRSGTLGLYRAMKLLGYSPYHMYECCLFGRLPHINVFKEAIVAYHNRFSGLKRYDAADYTKWFAEYDCLIEIPSYMGVDIINAYLSDPDVKFILTEREPASWVKSFNATVSQFLIGGTKFPVNIARRFEPLIEGFLSLGELMYDSYSDGRRLPDPENTLNLERNYKEYVQLVKKTVPADRLLHIRLEDGLGWEEICPFLGHPIPVQNYPGRNSADEFHAAVQTELAPRIKQGLLNFGAVAAPVVGAVGWASWRYGPGLLARIRS